MPVKCGFVRVRAERGKGSKRPSIVANETLYQLSYDPSRPAKYRRRWNECKLIQCAATAADSFSLTHSFSFPPFFFIDLGASGAFGKRSEADYD